MRDEAGHDPVADDHVMGSEAPGSQLFVDDELSQCIGIAPPGAGQRRRGVSEILEARHSLGTTGDRVEFVSALLADRIRPLGVGQCGAATRTILRVPSNAAAPTIAWTAQDSAGPRSPQS